MLGDAARPARALALDHGAGLGKHLGRRHVAEPPPGHRVRLAKPVDRQRPLKHSRQRREAHVLCAAVDDVLVNLVREHRKPRVLPHDVGNLPQLLLRVDRPRRVRRRAQDQQPGPLRQRTPQLVGGHQEPLARVRLHHHRLGARQTRHLGVAYPERGRDQHLVSRRAARQHALPHRLLGAVRQHNLVRRVRDAVLPLELLANLLLQQRHACVGRVPGDAPLECLDPRLHDRPRRVKVGLPGSEADHVDALRLERRRQVGQRHRLGGLDGGHPRIDLPHPVEKTIRVTHGRPRRPRRAPRVPRHVFGRRRRRRAPDRRGRHSREDSLHSVSNADSHASFLPVLSFLDRRSRDEDDEGTVTQDECKYDV